MPARRCRFAAGEPQASWFAGRDAAGPADFADSRCRRAEMQLKLQELLNSMEPLDREVLALRHFEELVMARSPMYWA